MVGVLAGKGEHLWVRRRAKAAQEHADEQQNKIVTVPGKQNAGQYTEQAAENDQAFTIAFSVGAPCQKLTDEDADDGASGKKEADHCRTNMNLIGQK